MSARPMYQPPNPQDMRRMPPASPSCARVRAKLRDYADGDLSMVDVASVDEHLHSCRNCAVELARSEHEVLRVRRAFEEIRIEQEADPKHFLRSDFAARVVEQLVLTEVVDAPSDRSARTDDAAGNETAGNETAGNGTAGNETVSASDANTRKAGGKPSRREGVLSFASPAGMLVAGLAALFVLGIGTRLMDWSVGKPGPFIGVSLATAAECYGENGPLSGGDHVGEEESLWLMPGGVATGDWHDASEFAQPAAKIEFQGGEVQVRDGAPLLLSGSKVLIKTYRPVIFPMADGSHLALGIGEYLIAAIPADMAEDVNQGPYDPTIFGSPNDVRIEFEVKSGQQAVIIRSGLGSGGIVAGSTASYYGGGPISITSVNGMAGGGQGQRVLAPPLSPPRDWVLSGRLLDSGGQPNVGAYVGITYIAAEQDYTEYPRTGADGSFRLDTDQPADRKFGIASTFPHPQRTDLGMVWADAVQLEINGEGARLERPLRIGNSAVVSGLVTDDQGVPQFGVNVIPLIIDELLGSVFVLELKRAVSAQNGRFEITQLPAYLPHHQRLALLLTHVLLEPIVVPVPVRESVLTSLEDTTYVMKKLRTVILRNLPKDKLVTIFEEIPGLPAGSAVVKREVYANTFGWVPSVKVGSGRMWMHSVSPTSRVFEILEPPQSSVTPVLEPALTSFNYELRLRPMENLFGTDLMLASWFRHQRIQVNKVENIVQSQTLRVVDASNQNVSGAQVFAVSKSALAGNPITRFLGFTGANGVHSLGAVKATEDVIVIGPSGGLSLAARPTHSGNPGQPVNMQLKASGSAVLAENLRPAATDPDRFLTITFYRAANEVLEGMQPVAVRFVTDGYWEMRDLPAGQYMADVRGQQYHVTVPSGGFVTIGGH